MNVQRHELPGGWVLVEGERDLLGRIVTYVLVGTPYHLVRLPTGWRAQVQPKGRQRRRYIGPGWESAPQAVRYLERYAYIRPDRLEPTEET